MIVALSVVVAGVLLALDRRVPASGWAAIFSTAGFFHGYAYGESIYGAETTPLAAVFGGSCGCPNACHCVCDPSSMDSPRYRASLSWRGDLWRGINGFGWSNNSGGACGACPARAGARVALACAHGNVCVVRRADHLNKGVIGAIESVCQHCCNMKDRDRILREKGERVRYVKLRGFQGTHLRRVRLIQ